MTLRFGRTDFLSPVASRLGEDCSYVSHHLDAERLHSYFHAPVHADQHHARCAPLSQGPQMGCACNAARDRLLLRGKLHHGAHRAGFTKVVVPGCAPMHLERDEVHHQRHHLDWRARQGPDRRTPYSQCIAASSGSPAHFSLNREPCTRAECGSYQASVCRVLVSARGRGTGRLVDLLVHKINLLNLHVRVSLRIAGQTLLDHFVCNAKFDSDPCSSDEHTFPPRIQYIDWIRLLAVGVFESVVGRTG